MPAPPRVLAWALAVLLLPTCACEIDTPAYDASSYTDPSDSRGAPPERPPLLPTAPPHSRPVSVAGTSSQVARQQSLDRDPDPFPEAKPALRPFVAGGDVRFFCPAGYSAQANQSDGCACVSSADHTTQYPLADAPCGDAAGRAEGSECIFTCAVGP